MKFFYNFIPLLLLLSGAILWGCQAETRGTTENTDDSLTTQTISKPLAETEPFAHKPHMEWFKRAKLGIFIHWGIYAVDGTLESWAFYRNEVPYDKYMAQANGFTASQYDPNQWAQLFKKAGAKYVVLTSKHHDGMALWDTKLSELNVVDATPAGRDLMQPYAQALRQHGLKVGVYFSHLDWSHPDYPTVNNHNEPKEKWGKNELANKYAYPPNAIEKPERWNKFLQFHRGQLKELSAQLNPDLFWFDGDWERNEEQWKMKDLRDSLQQWTKADVILNSRMKGYGDYETPEQYIPLRAIHQPWELCLTMNESWGYRQTDNDYKSAGLIIDIFCEVIGKGGNLLLDVGPKENGTIPQKQVETLEILGNWINKHQQAIYPTTAGLPVEYYRGASTLSQDSTTLYLFVKDYESGFVTVKGLRNQPKKISIMGSDAVVTTKRIGGAPWLNIPGLLQINLPTQAKDPYMTVVRIDLNQPINMQELKAGQGASGGNAN